MTKKFLALLCATGMLAVMSGVSSGASANYWEEGNNGNSWEKAYVIDSVEDFMTMINNSGSGRDEQRIKYFLLTTDLDLTSAAGLERDRIFIGHFDGQNHTIRININGSEFGVSLFGAVKSEATTDAVAERVTNDSIAIRNLKVVGNVSGGNATSGIATFLYWGVIENCSFTGNVEAATSQNRGNTYAGGIVGYLGGYNYLASVINCTFSGKVRAHNDISERVVEAGGIAGYAVGGNIENCRVDSGSEIYTHSAAGGIVGSVGGSAYDTENLVTYVTGCTSHAKLYEAGYKGGIVGFDPKRSGAVTYKSSLSGNTWPSEYPERGELDSSTDDDNIPNIPDLPSSSDVPSIPASPDIHPAPSQDIIPVPTSSDIPSTQSPDVNPQQPVTPETPASSDKTPSNSSGSSSGGSGGGCNSGFKFLLLAGVALLKLRRR